MILLAHREIKRAIQAGIINDAAAIDAALTRVSGVLRGFGGLDQATRFDSQIAQLKIPLLNALTQHRETQRLADERETASSTIKRDMFRQKALVHMLILRGLPVELIEAETERIFPADAQI